MNLKFEKVEDDDEADKYGDIYKVIGKDNSPVGYIEYSRSLKSFIFSPHNMVSFTTKDICEIYYFMEGLNADYKS